MNKQTESGIEWTDYTWNPVTGCRHACRWQFNGSTVICYAERMADSGRLKPFFPRGFSDFYLHPERLDEPLKLKRPSRIFLDSMSDLMGHWLPDEVIQKVLDVCAQAKHHTFQLLTKNPKRLRDFAFPSNVWVGISMPPDEMNGQALSRCQQERWLDVALVSLSGVRPWNVIRWVSFEPLSWDVAPVVARNWASLDWAVIGAGTNGRTVYQPDPNHVRALLDVLAKGDRPVFMKGNLRGNSAAERWREEFPE